MDALINIYDLNPKTLSIKPMIYTSHQTVPLHDSSFIIGKNRASTRPKTVKEHIHNMKMVINHIYELKK